MQEQKKEVAIRKMCMCVYSYYCYLQKCNVKHAYLYTHTIACVPPLALITSHAFS